MIYGQNAELLHPHPRRPGVLRGYAARVSDPGPLLCGPQGGKRPALAGCRQLPGGELAGELLQKMQRLEDHK